MSSAQRAGAAREGVERDDLAADAASHAIPAGRLGVVLSLLALYVIWGSTYLAIRVAVETLPPYFMGGTRFVVAGAALYIFQRARGAPAPTRNQWLGAAAVGGLLLMVGNGGVAFAEQKVASGLAATMVAAVPLWAALFSGLFGRWSNRFEAVGLVVGFMGVGLLNLEGNLRANPLAAVVLVVAAAGWAFGSIWSRRLPLPTGMMASAAEMLTGGSIMVLASLVRGERITALPSGRSLLALVYLMVFGSFVAFSAYVYLLRRVRPALATSYAYVNPMVAVLLGVVLAGEKISARGIVALFVILIGVGLVMLGRER